MSNTLQHTGTQQSLPLTGFGERFGLNALRQSRIAGDKLDQFSFDIQITTTGRTLAAALVWPEPSGLKLRHHLPPMVQQVSLWNRSYLRSRLFPTRGELTSVLHGILEG